MQYIDGLAQGGQAGATIFGRVARERRVVREEGDTYEYVPLAGVKVVIEGGGKIFRAETDASGKYSAGGLPPGEYAVRAELPGELAPNGDPDKIRVVERGCGVASVFARADGRLSGRVFDAAGRPAAKVSLRLSDAARGETYFRGYTNYATTDSEGRYEFKGVPEGRYVLRLRFDGDATDSGRPFPVVYHPNAGDAARATVITIGEGEKVEGYDLHLSPLPAERTIEGVALYPDGAPAANVRVTYTADLPYLDVGYGAEADSAGRFAIKVYEGVGLKVSTSVRRKDDTWASSGVVRVPQSGPVGELRLTVPRP